MNWDSIASFVNQVGFPMFVAVYMLVKGSAETRELTRAVQSLEKAILTFSFKEALKRETMILLLLILGLYWFVFRGGRMERQLFFLLLIMGGIWLIWDDLSGEKYLSRFIARVVA